ncbi:MAG: DUF362 domain-containing protein [Desulfatiglans sp.]|jgi:hypothetical protein|nr:DUF362 domain-containing protein [Thermodesulfobacteriota bacterium]MEE4354329.1 DUF362 domain-containing protein [Desulfatiglans sp.]
MDHNERTLTRRDFMKGTAMGILAATSGFPSVALSRPIQKSRVVVIRDVNAIDAHGLPNMTVLEKMLDRAVMLLVSKNDPLEAWQQLIDKDDVVGIKSNVWHYLPTPGELEQTIRHRVMSVGVADGDIAIDDRGVLNNPVFQRATALINTRPVRTHYWAGIGGCLKNYIMFTPSPYAYHGDSCADLAKVWKFPIVKDKTRLIVLSALRAQFHGRGPHHFDRRYVWDYRGLIVGTDPVAVDRIALELIRNKRKAYFGEERNLATPPHHIIYADTRYRLGTSDLNKIELIKKGWQQNILL